MGWTPSVTIGKEKVSKHKKHWENQTKPQNKKTTQDSCLGSLHSQEFFVFFSQKPRENQTKKTIFRDSWLNPPHLQDLWRIVSFCVVSRFLCFFFWVPKKNLKLCFSWFFTAYIQNFTFSFCSVAEEKHTSQQQHYTHKHAQTCTNFHISYVYVYIPSRIYL